MKKLFLSLVFLFASYQCISQVEWDYLGSDTTFAYDQRLVECNDGSFLIACTIKHAGIAGQISIKKISPAGLELFQKIYHREFATIFDFVHFPSDNSILLFDLDNSYYELLKLSGEGDSISSTILSSGADFGSGVKAVWNKNESIYIVGNAWGTNPFGEPYGGFFYDKVDTNGMALNFNINSFYPTQCVSANQYFNATGLSVNSLDQMWLAYNRNFGLGPCAPVMAMVVTNSDGDSLFTYHNINQGVFTSLTCTDDNGCLADKYISTGDADSLIKFSHEGTIEWRYDLQNEGGMIVQTNDGNVLIASDGFRIRKIKIYGGELWNHVLNADMESRILDVLQAADSSFVLTGTRQDTSSGIYHTYVLKTVSDKLLAINEVSTGVENFQGSLVPNPSKDIFRILLSHQLNPIDLDITITNLLGENISGFKVERITNESYEVRASSIAPGTYIVKLLEGQNIIGLLKWVKQ